MRNKKYEFQCGAICGEKAIKELPREAEIIDLFKRLAGGDPLPPVD